MTNSVFNQAQQLISQGLFDKALKTLKTTEQENINNANYWFFVGLCYASLKQYPDAEYSFKRTVKFSPQAIQAWSNLGLTCLNQQKFPAAISAFQNAIALDNKFIDALYNLAVTYHRMNQMDKAINYAKRAIKINKNHFQTHNILGLCTQHNDITQSESSFKTAIQLNLHFYDAWHNLIDTYMLHNRKAEAEAAINSALTVFSNNVALYKKLGELYESKNDHNRAISIYSDTQKIEPQNIDIKIAMARSHLAVSDFDECERLLNEVLALYPEHLDANVEKCSLLIAQRKYQNAYENLKPLVGHAAEKPGIIIAYANVCKLLNKPELALDTLIHLNKKELPKNVLELSGFTLADSYDQKHDYENAFQQYQAANGIFNDATDIHYYKKTISSLIKNINRETLDALPHSGNASSEPVFIVGMPRSGTTLVEQVLSSHPEVYGAGEITDLWAIGNKISGAMNLNNYTRNIKKISPCEVEQYSLEYLKKIAQLSSNTAHCTDKLPHNFFHIGLIELLFPNAKIIHCSRHPFDTCLSIYFKKFNDNHRYARNLKEIALFYQSYRRLMQHWHDNSRLKIHEAVYENIVTEPETNIRQMLQHINVEWHNACLRHHESKRLIMTPSHSQASKPLYTSSINRWKHYINYLQPLSDILGDPEDYL